MRWEPLLLGVALPLKILGEQVYGWLRSGEWVAVSAIDLLMLGWDDPWLTYPQDWIGGIGLCRICPAPCSLLLFCCPDASCGC